MIPDKFENMFNEVSKNLTLRLISESSDTNTIGEVSENKPIWDFLDDYDGSDVYLDNGELIKLDNLKKRPLRILFFIYLSEIESRLFKIIKIKFPEIYHHLSNNLTLTQLKKLLESCPEVEKTKIGKIIELRNKTMHMDTALQNYELNKLREFKKNLIEVNGELQEMLANIIH